MAVKGFAAQEKNGSLTPYSFESAPLGASDVEIAVTHCGICHSDVHLIDNDWGFSQYPLVPGHEVVGTIKSMGKQVSGFQTGDRVGVGWQAGACLSCDLCQHGDDQFCQQSQPTCVGRPGGYAETIRVHNQFAFHIPASLSSEGAAPLLCGGITVYSPLRQYDVRPAMKVGVIGIGGLGHLALQYARAFGCEVTAFSSSPSKEEEAKRLGAHHFVNAKDPKQMKDTMGTLDFVLATVSANIDWPSYFAALRPRGKFVVVGAPSEPIALPPFALIDGQKTLAGSMIGSRWIIREMLDFSARHGIEAQTEVMAMTDVNAALDKVRKNEARYRLVLKN